MLGNPLRITLGRTEVYLLPQRALYIPVHRMLVIADWHLGKLQHFRKNGIFVPQNAITDELQHLTELINTYPIQHILFLGDLFHSSWNADWDVLVTYLSSLAPVECSLVIGNHDLIDFQQYDVGGLAIYNSLSVDGMLFSHHPLTSVPKTYVNIAGHIHPGIMVRAKGRQRYRLPCFYHLDQTLILPAFGNYTGIQTISPSKDADVYLIVGDDVLLRRNRY